ncbi:hypothetical protein AB0395_37400 [Streptosporangium sp. NPDC051023]|uniref:hypothetical protein n=1 Tax=Streptosporangium sp. NPDC051023 TaxID=3155410 RepID=UPI00344B790C
MSVQAFGRTSRTTSRVSDRRCSPEGGGGDQTGVGGEPALGIPQGGLGLGGIVENLGLAAGERLGARGG